MDPRKLVLDSLNHREGSVPVDFGATGISGIHVSSVASLRRYFGLVERPVKVIEPYQMLGEVDEELKSLIGIDTEAVGAYKTMFGFPNADFREWRTPWGQIVLVPGDFNTVTDGKDVLIFPEGDTSVPPSARMPSGGYFFDSIPRQLPIDEDDLRPEDNLEEFGEVDDATLSFLKNECLRARSTGRAVVAGLGGTGLGDIALVPGPMMKRPRGIRDVAEWYVSTVARQDYVRAVFEGQTEIALKNLARIASEVRDLVDVAVVCGTDFGTQSSLFCSPETFDSLYLPYYRRINDWIHGNTPWKTFKHSCGAVEPLIDHFIEAGFDILNPVQCSARGMEPENLKKTYGARISFWGGGVDTQKTLPFGSPEDVRREVLSRCEIFSAGGGFIFNSIHNVQAKTPVENIVAMLSAVREWNGLPSLPPSSRSSVH